MNRQNHPVTRPTRRAMLAGLGAGAAALLAGCSDANPFAVHRRKGSIVVGSQQYYSNEIIAELFAQAIEAKGLTVQREFRIGQREAYLPEIASGSIDVIPEYGGNLLQHYQRVSATAGTGPAAGAASPAAGPTTAEAVQEELTRILPGGLRVLAPAEATDQDSFAVTRASAEEHGLTSIGDLAGLGRAVRMAANSEFMARPYGPAGVKSVYGVDIEVTPVEDSGGPLTVKALTDGSVDVADIYSSDPVIEANGLVILEDPAGLIAPQRVTPLVAEALAPTAVEAIDAVCARLGPGQLRALNARSTGEQLAAEVIAADWLAAQGLAG
ncbi:MULTISPECIES: ABC transporter substrate-binding protein [Actinomyces]|uniref:ABC transporter substrate-binding protein n=1 Tax=Actinomyces marmotae TaxID=2737173 RepID=A0A6M8AY87_9ACTO|nr:MULTISPECIES: ABC transporter substrate-binding protein [Actinomyces]QKD79459.1 ABC transporter substrate-binding protein [Actinomyces marmotae]